MDKNFWLLVFGFSITTVLSLQLLWNIDFVSLALGALIGYFFCKWREG